MSDLVGNPEDRFCCNKAHLSLVLRKPVFGVFDLVPHKPGCTGIGLYSHRRWLEAGNFGFRKKRDCTIYVAKSKMLISYAVTAKLICIFVFAKATRYWLQARLSVYPPAICRSKPCKFVQKIFFSIKLLHAHLQYMYVCNIPIMYQKDTLKSLRS